jgi:hypothetical protein
MVGIYRRTTLMMLSSTFLTPVTGALEGTEGASLLLDGEEAGFSIDATSYDTVTAATYTGGPVGGTVSIGTGGVFSSDNVALDSSILTQAGTSPKMVHFDESPYVRWTPHNYQLQSQTFNTTWSVASSQATISADATTAPDGTSTADTIVSGSGAGFHFVRYQLGVTGTTAGFVYTASVYAKPNGYSWIQFGLFQDDTFANYARKSFDVTNGTVGTTSTAGSFSLLDATITSVGNGWYRCTVTALASTTVTMQQIAIDSTDDFTSKSLNGTSGVHVWGAQVNRGYTALPYLATTTAARIGIPQAYDAYEDCFGVLAEPAATNLVVRSEEFGTTWTIPSAGSVTSNTTTAPDGSTTADTWTAAGAADAIRQTLGASGTTARTVSVYAKKNNVDYIKFGISDFAANAGEYYFNLNTGTAASSSVAGDATINSQSITAVGDGWYRLQVTVTFATSHSPTYIAILPTQSDSGDSANTDALYLWGAQAESGSVATSYIPTLGSTVTRAVDAITVACSSIPYSTTKCTGYIDLKSQNVSDINEPAFWEISADVNNRYGTYQDTAGPKIFNLDGGVSDVDADFGTMVNDTRTQLTAAFQTNDFDASQDGAAVTSDGAGTLDSTAAASMTLRLGGTIFNSAYHFSGHIYRFTYVPRQVQTEG